MRIQLAFSAILSCFLAGMSSAHELWIAPLDWQVAPSGDISAHLRNGERFEGSTLAWFDRNIARAEVAGVKGVTPLTGRLGDRPALQIPDAQAGLAVLIYETKPSTISYKTWEKFQKFVDHKDLGVTKSAHLAAGHPETGFTESYTRHAKALVAVGDGAGTDRAFGLETELVALTNPFAAGSEMRVRLLYQGEPRKAEQIELFEKAPDGTVEVRLMRTDTEGEATFAVKADRTYLLDAVVLRDSARAGAIYDTLWAGLSFYVP